MFENLYFTRSVATQLRCGWIFNNHINWNFFT